MGNHRELDALAAVMKTPQHPLPHLSRACRSPKIGLEHARHFVNEIYGPDLHALRVLSLGNALAGLLNAAVLSVAAIGQAYANPANIKGKSGIKQVDRCSVTEA
jgi:hypothetical protein